MCALHGWDDGFEDVVCCWCMLCRDFVKRVLDTEYVCVLHGWDDGFEYVVCCWLLVCVWVVSLIHYLKK